MIVAILLLVAFGLILLYNWTPEKTLPRAPKSATKPHYTFENRAAVHEAGHAVAAWACTVVAEVNNVTIEHKDGGGITEYKLWRDDSVEAIWCSLVISLAGIAAEISAYGRMQSAEGKSDLQTALRLAKKLVKLGKTKPPWKVPRRDKSLPFDKMFTKLSLNQQSVMTVAYYKAHSVIESHGNGYYRVVSALLAKKTIGPSGHRIWKAFWVGRLPRSLAYSACSAQLL